jgi:hypothetical protein
MRGHWRSKMKKFFTLLPLLALIFSSFPNAYAGGAEIRIKTAKGLTATYKAKGFPVTFEAEGEDKRIIRITQKNIIQNPPLTEGQMITLLGTYLKNGIQSRLKNEGFISGVLVDGKLREYPFGL